MCIGYKATSVYPGNSCRDSAHRTTGGKRSRRRMETESPQGLNLHPAKQPRTTLFDWLPAGLPSVPTWTNLHESGSLRVSLFFSPSRRRLIFSFLPSNSLLSFCFFGTVLLSSSHLLTLSSLWPPRSSLDRFSGESYRRWPRETLPWTM